MRLVSWSLSDVGRKRDHNEDSHLDENSLGLYAVADGMGGHQGGDRASRMAIDVLRREVAAATDLEGAAARILADDPLAASLPRDVTRSGGIGLAIARWAGAAGSGGDEPREVRHEAGLEDTAELPPLVTPPAAATILRFAARAAGRTIYDAAQDDPSLAGMGTTLTAVLFHRDRAHVVHVGDSRAFLYRDGQVSQVTEDHSWIAEQVRAGVLSEVEARESKFRHIITRSVGFEREVEVDLLGVPVVPGDCLLLCSDGMSNYVDADELGRILATTYYSKVPRLLVDLANDRGGDDNITVVLVYVANDAGR